MRIDELYLMNPWWRSPEEIYADKNIRTFEKSTFRYYPEKFFREIPKEKTGIYTIRGPRQIGKTTFLKLYIKKLIEDGVNPSNIFFFTCDGISDRFDLIETVRIFFQMFEGKPGEIRYIFIDEITAIEDWQKSLKYLVDIGLLDNCLVVLTGSSAYDLKKSSERLPGRKGHGKDLVYIPITFGEFLRSLGIEVERKTIEEILTISTNDLNRLYLRNAFLKEHFLKYLNTGGFPKVIDDFLREGRITDMTKNVYKDFILGDAEKYLKARTNLLEILRKLPDIVGQRFSWNSLVDVFTGTVESVDTIQKYFEYLGYSFIFMNVFFIDISRKVIRSKKQKKTYPIDKVVADIISDISGKTIELPQIIEMLTLRHLLKDSDLIHHGMNLYDGPFFWYSGRGNEINFVYNHEGTLVPVEVKYQSRINKSDYTGMKRVFGKGILITQDTIFKDEGIVGIPAWLFLAVIKTT
ncbi:MAG: uncharacterized protein PWQ20_1435 [Thermotogaceae bacterium]|nr:uncharacterized protein [Thermotogaceae bacterium]